MTTKYKITRKDKKIDARNLKDYYAERDNEKLRHSKALKRIHKKYEITPKDLRVDSRNGRDSRGW